MIRNTDSAMVHIKKVMQLIDKLTGDGCRSAENVFVDFLTLSACSYSNAFDTINRAMREEEYLAIIKKYSKEEINYFAEAVAEILMAAEIYLNQGYIKDIFGYIYTTRQYYKKSMAQYFTPDNIALFMSSLTNSNFKQLETEEFISISEPTCGSGIMVLAFAQNMLTSDINYQNSMLADAWDLDKTCALMTYVQFSIYNIPAIVTHGDSLAQKTYSRWITPMYYINDFPGKQRRKAMSNAFKNFLADIEKPAENVNIEESATVQFSVSDIDMQDIREQFVLQSLFDEAI